MRLWSVLIVAIMVIVPVALSAEELSDATSASKVCFVDLDGDGLDDNIRDFDGDGIPDFENPVGTPSIPSGGSGIFAIMEPPTPVVATKGSDEFGDRKFCTRWLASNRGGFSSGDGFGPGAGIGSAAMGKVCIGGVCF
ncbi:MAG: hypothetical protein KOO62_06855 [candidate division Zixibacteria bacterium]|nr:hypothetical protein [candidate division Zixibacteria bacterium]